LETAAAILSRLFQTRASSQGGAIVASVVVVVEIRNVSASAMRRPVAGGVATQFAAKPGGHCERRTEQQGVPTTAMDGGRRKLAVVIVAECTAQFHLPDVLSSLTDEPSASGPARGAVDEGGGEKDATRET
jgi:hypothetical protein